MLWCGARGRFHSHRGGEEERPPNPSGRPGGCTRDSSAVGDDFLYPWNHSLVTASSQPPSSSSSCAAAEAGCRHSAVSSPPYLLVSLKNVGGREDGGGTELAAGATGRGMLLASPRQPVARPGQPAPASRGWPPGHRAGVVGQESCLVRGPPCALLLHPEPGHRLTWDNLSGSGDTAPGPCHSFPNLPGPSINASFFKRVTWKVCLQNFAGFP